LKRIVKDI